MTDTVSAFVDDSLLAQRAARNVEAFLALYDRYFARVYMYFRHRCAEAQTCDDLTAQTFEQALSHICDYCPDRGSFAAWLFGIARNIANAHFRRTLRFQWVPLELVRSLPGRDPLPEETAIETDQQQVLLRCIQELSPRQRDLLALKFAAGLTNRQIAQLTGLGEQNVGVILHRSIRHLRKRMEAPEDRRARQSAGGPVPETTG